MSIYRQLTDDEKILLERNGCIAQNWEDVSVKESFQLSAFRFVEFRGSVKIGEFTQKDSSVSFAVLEQVEILGDVIIRNIGRRIFNCIISENAVIENVAEISFETGANAGIGELASVLVESGGREVTLFAELSAQTAYFEAFVSSKEFKLKYRKLVNSEIEKNRHAVGWIGTGAVIRNCGRIADSVIGMDSCVEGADEILNSTINGFVGAGSILADSVVAENGYVGKACLLKNCFVGNGAVIDQGFSAENSLFFSNTECLRGEGCSVFAGAYTSSHHKSTLLLAAMYSFYTAGSGSNFSNHRFKLGPVHQGIIERGSKTGSSSYLIWPSHIAPFTTVIGKHLKKIDSAVFPFSLLLEQKGKSLLLPGALLFSAGFERDCAKWLVRDKRDAKAVDFITPYALTPYTVGKIIKAIQILKELKNENEKIRMDGFEIPVDYISKAMARYHAGVNYYYGSVVTEILKKYYSANERILDHVVNVECEGDWGDYAGLVAPAEMIQQLIREVESDIITDYGQFIRGLKKLNLQYKHFEWEWVIARFGELDLASDKKAFVDILENYAEAAELRLRLVERDAEKEYANKLRVGYGCMGDADTDFVTVRGKCTDNIFLKDIREQTEQILSETALLKIKILETDS